MGDENGVDLDDDISDPALNLIVEAGQVAGALVILEALPPQANAQSIPSVTSAGDSHVASQFCLLLNQMFPVTNGTTSKMEAEDHFCVCLYEKICQVFFKDRFDIPPVNGKIHAK